MHDRHRRSPPVQAADGFGARDVDAQELAAVLLEGSEQYVLALDRDGIGDHAPAGLQGRPGRFEHAVTQVRRR